MFSSGGREGIHKLVERRGKGTEMSVEGSCEVVCGSGTTALEDYCRFHASITHDLLGQGACGGEEGTFVTVSRC